MKIEIKKIGNSDGLLLPRELMQRLDLTRAQQLHITALPGAGYVGNFSRVLFAR
jgi:antitoxin component of MazEF toxin-antitoxin module